MRAKEPRHWVIGHTAPTLTTNAERRLHHFRRAEIVREWRYAFMVLAKAAHVPPLERASVTAQPFQERGRIGDIGSVWPTIKAAIDGICDAGVLPDDDPSHLVEIRLRPALRGPAGLTLTITEVTAEQMSLDEAPAQRRSVAVATGGRL